MERRKLHNLLLILAIVVFTIGVIIQLFMIM